MTKVISIKFLFANRDGVVLEQDADMNALVSEVKEHLLAAWPKEAGNVHSEEQIRLVCMGKGILPNHKTLEACKVPIFANHPTPINISIRELSAIPSGQGASCQPSTNK
mmetsp:Transcript_31374/g.106351  ORF Transcript_31374/g.106351 Transcript_31374/m.106351 type:complete len:109 (+) Transcript_31374:90-416(+)